MDRTPRGTGEQVLSVVHILALMGPWLLLYTLIAYGELKTTTFSIWMVFVAIDQGVALLRRRREAAGA
jgi:hypothetical protein